MCNGKRGFRVTLSNLKFCEGCGLEVGSTATYRAPDYVKPWCKACANREPSGVLLQFRGSGWTAKNRTL